MKKKLQKMETELRAMVETLEEKAGDAFDRETETGDNRGQELEDKAALLEQAADSISEVHYNERDNL